MPENVVRYMSNVVVYRSAYGHVIRIVRTTGPYKTISPTPWNGPRVQESPTVTAQNDMMAALAIPAGLY